MSTAAKQPIVFGKYLLLDRVNIGGMAEVYRAKTFGANGFERLVAVKRILPTIAEDQEFISMFIDEAKITVQLAHANIAQVYELAQVSNAYFIAMEYVSGRDMRAVFERCRKRGEPAPLPLTCYLVARCCEGLDYAHRKKDQQGRDMHIVHRDVSPQNALISYDGEVKVIDFGIAKAAGKVHKTQAGILKGKFGYMSPEQIRGLPLDRRSDVFALGVCLYEMLTGERLFIGNTDFEVLEKVRKVEVVPPSHFNRKIPPALEKVVLRALAKDVEDRYQYASELGDDLQRFIIGADSVFGRKDLAAFMRATFAEEVEREQERLQEYALLKPTEALLAASSTGLVGGVVAASSQSLGGVPSQVTGLPLMASPEVGTGTQRPFPRPGGPPVPVPAGAPRLRPPVPAPVEERPEHAETQVVPPGDVQHLPAARGGGPGAPGSRPLIRQVSFDEAQAQREADTETRPGRSGQSGSTRILGSSRPIPLEQVVGETSPEESPTGAHALGGPSASGRGRSGRGLRPASADDGLQAVPARAPSPVFRLLAGLVVLLVVAGAGLFLATRPPAQGLLLVDPGLPEEVARQARVSVNGQALQDEAGQAVRHFPHVAKVPAGKVTVMIAAPGYETLVQVVEVAPGTEFTPLSSKPKKQEP